MPTLIDIIWLTAMAAMMGLTVAGVIGHTRQIGGGRADPIVAPDWTSVERPVSSLAITWGLDDKPEIDDDHVGRPFPLAAPPHRIGDLSRGQGDHGTPR